MTRAALAAAAVFLASRMAEACPACATREAAGLGTYALVGAMIAVPYIVSVVAIRVIRGLDGDPRV